MTTMTQPTTSPTAPKTTPVLLGATASRRCPRRVHGDHDATVQRPPWSPPEPLALRFDAADGWRTQVFDRLVELHGDAVADLRTAGGSRVDATTRAMDGGALLVVGGRLPDDTAGGRRGAPDVLLRLGDGYVPVLVKWHKGVSASARRSVEVSPLDDPATRRELAGVAARTQRFDDLLELAHHTRLLQACGRHAGTTVGAVLGTDELDLGTGADLALVWHDLDVPRVTTFSRSRGTARRTALERYDHEHGFRVRVAQVAQRRHGMPDDPAPLVVPVAQPECLTCPYQQPCADELGPDDPSLALTSGRLTVREWLTLQSLGVTTTADLAEVDPDEPADLLDAALVEAFLDENAHDRAAALRRLREAAVRARMVRDGVELAPLTDGPVHVPRADVEIDLDYESDTEGRVYLWGARLASRPGPDADHGLATYHPFVSWEPLDDDAERAVAQDLVDWLRGQVAAAGAAGRTLEVHHWTGVEADALRKLLGDGAADVLARFVDLHDVVRRQFRGLHGLGLKAVAPQFGFGWRDDDAGGAQSQVWLQVARDPSDPACERMRRRVLEYNEDDVEATAAVRAGLSRLAEGGSGVSPR